MEASELKLFAVDVTISLDGLEHFELEQLYVQINLPLVVINVCCCCLLLF